MPNNYHLVCTHRNSFLSYEPYWRNFSEDFHYLVDTTNAYLKPSHKFFNYDEQELRNSLKFDGQVSKKHFWNSQGNRNVVWFYAHFRMVWFYKQNSFRDFYWFYDDDVTVADWDSFHKAFENNDADFISYYCFKEQNVNSQSLIPKIDKNTASGNGWFDRFPGDGDILFDDTTEYFGSFFPIVRYSNKALSKLFDAAVEGLHGYSEGFVPTYLNYLGMKLDTIFDETSNSKYFDNSKVQVKHKNQSINWAWI